MNWGIHAPSMTHFRVSVNPESGQTTRYRHNPMATPRYVPPHAIVATNVQNLLDRDCPPDPKKGRRGQIRRFIELHPTLQNRLSKIQRALKDGGMNLASLEELAKAFKLHPYQLLIDKLDVHDPQIAVRRRVYESLRQAASAIEES